MRDFLNLLSLLSLGVINMGLIRGYTSDSTRFFYCHVLSLLSRKMPLFYGLDNIFSPYA